MSDDIKTHSGRKYVRPIRSCLTHQIVGEVDVYAVLVAFNVTCPATQHAVKKLLCAGLRGKADRLKDLNEARDSITRAAQMEAASTKEEIQSEPAQQADRKPLPVAQVTYCHAHKDGDCTWPGCPQNKDGEPERSGRSCPLPWGDEV